MKLILSLIIVSVMLNTAGQILIQNRYESNWEF